MKTITIVLINILFITVALLANDDSLTNLKITSRKDIRDTTLVISPDSKIHLHLSSYPITGLDIKKFSQKPWFSQVTEVTLSRLICPSRVYLGLIEALKSAGIRHLNIIELQVKDLPEEQLGAIFATLESISIIRTELPDHFYSNFTPETAPHLRKIVLQNAGIGKDFVKNIVENGFITQLETLDLSGNKIGQELLNTLPVDTPGKLRVLRLNDTKLKRDAVFPDWDALFFQNLKELEIYNIVETTGSFSNLPGDSVIQQLDVFIGMMPEFDPDAQQISDNYLRSVLEYPIKSRRNNYSISSPGLLEEFNSSPQSSTTENLILAGQKWMDVTLTQALGNLRMPSVKQIHLVNVGASQASILQIVRNFPQYQFEIIIIPRRRHNYEPEKPNAIIYDPKIWPSVQIIQP